MVKHVKKAEETEMTGEENLEAYSNWLVDSNNQILAIACYCFGMIVACLEKRKGFYWFSEHCVNPLIKVGDKFEVPIRLLYLLSTKKFVSLKGLSTEAKEKQYDELEQEGYKMGMNKSTFAKQSLYAQYTLPDGVKSNYTGLICFVPNFDMSTSFPWKMEQAAKKHGYVLNYTNVTSLNTNSPEWKFLEEVYGEEAYWIEWGRPESFPGSIYHDAVAQLWDQGRDLVAGRIGLILNFARVEGVEGHIAIFTNFKGPFRQLSSCLPTKANFRDELSEKDGKELKMGKGNRDPILYYDDVATGLGVGQQEVAQSGLQLMGQNLGNFAQLYGLLLVEGVGEGCDPVIPSRTFLPFDETQFWRSLSSDLQTSLKKRINEYKELFETQLRLGFFSPSDLLHENQLENHSSDDAPSAWIWCYLVLHGGPWSAGLWVGTKKGSESRNTRRDARLEYLVEDCNYDKKTDEHNRGADLFQRKVLKGHHHQFEATTTTTTATSTSTTTTTTTTTTTATSSEPVSKKAKKAAKD
ncbi:hypothetical protein TrCOL_g12182 [Triparma columacea]|uniref:Uncharacterized protein n=1 Tax=Triparma columacea TaxID=722753 RepID=A0A9W7G428_9STRA|nr:hypothetical protein TrCOL_g12182 [Triparma columacea]